MTYAVGAEPACPTAGKCAYGPSHLAVLHRAHNSVNAASTSCVSKISSFQLSGSACRSCPALTFYLLIPVLNAVFNISRLSIAEVHVRSLPSCTRMTEALGRHFPDRLSTSGLLDGTPGGVLLALVQLPASSLALPGRRVLRPE